MPAELPPNSGYTYAVELGLAGVQGAAFDPPVIHHVENFLGFPVGTPVPAGRFDEETDTWVPSENGRVIAIVGERDGLAEIDVDGKGAASEAKLEALGITDAERRRLAELYDGGQTLWRVPIGHFSAWDFNWPFGPPEGAGTPDGDDPRGDDDDPEEPDEECGSRIAAQTQVLGESIPVPGTPYSLRYASDRTPGRRASRSVTIPLTGATVPPQVTGVELEISIAGQEHVHHFEPAPDLRHTFVWDGKDAYGRALQGRQKVLVRIGFTYKAVYQRPDEHERSFARYSGTPVTADAARKEITLWREWTSLLGPWDTRGLGLGGWSLDVHHVLDRAGAVVHLGDGGRRRCDVAPGDATLDVLMADERALAKLDVGTAVDVAVDRAGWVYLSDSSGAAVYRAAPDGRLELYAGHTLGGEEPFAETWYGWQPHGLAVGPDGYLYVTCDDQHCVLRIGPDRSVVWVAGTGDGGFRGDGGPATKARLSTPHGVAVGPDGAVYIADTGNRRIRRAGPDGVLTTIAGNGEEANAGDGGPAVDASFEDPQDVAVGPDGSVYVADTWAVRRIAPDGTISTVAGADLSDWEGPATGLATAVGFKLAHGIDVGPDGAIYLGTWDPNVVWRIGRDGVMAPLAGGGEKRPTSGSPAREVALGRPMGVAMGPDGVVHFANDGILGQGAAYLDAALSVRATFEGQALGETAIPDESGDVLYLFDASGRHRRTLDALTGAERHRFDYDDAGRLTRITSDAAPAVSVEHDAHGNPTEIAVAGRGRVKLTVTRDGWLASVEAGEGDGGGRYAMAYERDGLLTSFERPSAQASAYAYDEQGRLVRDEAAGGRVTDIVRTERANGFEVRLLRGRPPALRETSYVVERLPAGGQRRVARCCTQVTTTETAVAGSRTTRTPEGVVVTEA
ncbi:MAG: hypothetical protein M3389_08195, partial [Actinomycetota bacterium]|nr:hypothetical protein [Actinomycetota bacterium]